MKAHHLMGVSFATALMLATSVAAQDAPGAANDPVRDTATAQDTATTQPSSQGAAASEPAAGMVKVVGCVQKETDVLNTRGIGVGDEYVLTDVGKDAHASAPADASGASGEATRPAASASTPAQRDPASMPSDHAAMHGGMYTLTGDKEDDLGSLVGKRVEITGRLEHAGGSASADDDSASAPAGTSGTADADAGDDGSGNDADRDDVPSATNTGSTLAEDPRYEGSRSPDAQEGIEARERAKALPRIDVSSFREIEGNCEAPQQR